MDNVFAAGHQQQVRKPKVWKKWAGRSTLPAQSFGPDSDQQPITQEEWLSLVASDPELKIDPRNNGPCFALWTVHWVDGDHPWFDWNDGEICTKNPDRKTLRKAIQIAEHFQAHVQGDDGEEPNPAHLPEAYS